MRVDWKRLVTAVGVCEAAGIVGFLASAQAVGGWYVSLVKPTIAPPNWLFGPVWTLLYMLMGISLYLTWEKKGDLRWFGVQLGLNVMWSILFFGVRAPGWAFAEILILWVTIVMTMKKFEPKSRLAAGLLGPYLWWVSFAAALNLVIWRLN